MPFFCKRRFQKELWNQFQFLKNETQQYVDQANSCKYYLEVYLDAIGFLNADKTVTTLDEFQKTTKYIIM